MSLITLTEDELVLGDKIGRQRNEEDISYGLPVGGAFTAFDSGGYEQNILGVCGEIAFAKFMKLPYVAPAMKSADVGGYEVRTASKPTYNLIIRPRDKDERRFALVVRHERSIYRIVGWMTAGEAKKVGTLKNPEAGRGAGAAWFVYQRQLHTKFEYL